jgi:hypothetical protein
LIPKLIFLSASKADPTGETDKVFSFVRTALIDAYIFVKVSNQRFLTLKTRPKAPEGAVVGAGTGGVIGGALGWIAGIGALAIPESALSSQPARLSPR